MTISFEYGTLQSSDMNVNRYLWYLKHASVREQTSLLGRAWQLLPYQAQRCGLIPTRRPSE